MRKNHVGVSDLVAAIDEMRAGLVDADLGGHIFKKRLPLTGRGKRSGARTIVATRTGRRWIYLFGFEKNDRSSIDPDELQALQAWAKVLLNLSDQEIALAVMNQELVELKGETE